MADNGVSTLFSLTEMNRNSVNDGVIPIEHSFDEQYLQVDNQRDENSIPSQSNLATSIKVIAQAKKLPTNPTPLYDFFAIVIT